MQPALIAKAKVTGDLEVASPKSALRDKEVVGVIPHRPPNLPNAVFEEIPSRVVYSE